MTHGAASADVDFDVIVIGAGVAGCITAHQLAARGHSVLVAERGPAPGSKNLSGGVLYCRVLESIFPDFVREAPVERQVVRHCLSFLTPTSSVSLDYRDERLGEPVNAVTVLRAKLDPWLADRAEAAGATVMPGVRVDGLVTDGDRVVGIRAGDDVLRAHVVVAADGVNSFIARDAGFRPKDAPNHLAVGVKSVIGLPAATIQERFNLTGDEGAAYAFVGDCTDGIAGGGFLYTNRESISIGVVLRLDDLQRRGASTSDVHDRFLEHPAVGPLIRDGEFLEYGCHLVAEGGRAMVRDLARDGFVIVGEAAGLCLNTGFTVRGMDLAAASGVAAATAIDAALRAGDVSRAALDAYRVELERTFVGQDMRTFARAPSFLENPRLYESYGPMVSDVLRGIYHLDGKPRRRLVRTALAAQRRSRIGLVRLARDAIAAARAI